MVPLLNWQCFKIVSTLGGKKVQKEIVKESEEQGFGGRFGAGLPRISDGSFLFLQHLISKMKKEGLVTVNQGMISITKAGRESIKISNIAPIRREYKKSTDNMFKIVAFDIPEKRRADREWLRWSLNDLGFKMLQKSVWIGKVAIPKEFIDDLRRYDLLEYLDIIGITKTGTIRDIS